MIGRSKAKKKKAAKLQSRREFQWIPHLFALIFAFLAVVIWLPQSAPPVVQPPKAALDSEDLAAQLAEQLARGAESLSSRPIFNITRRPPEVAAPAAAPQVTISLVGILNTEGRQIALLRMSNSPDLVKRRVGEKIGKWQVKSITPAQVVLSSEGAEDQVMILGAN